MEQYLSGMEEGVANAAKREAASERKLAVAEEEATQAKAEQGKLEAKCREQATKLQRLRRKMSAEKEAASQAEEHAAEEAAAASVAGWEAQVREQAETIDTQSRKLRELSRQLAEHRVSRDNANAQAEQLGTENEQLRKKVASLESGIKEHTAERRKTDQLQRTLNTERERWADATAARNEQHEMEVNKMQAEFAKLLQERDAKIAQLSSRKDAASKRGGGSAASRGKTKKAAPQRSTAPRQSPKRARAQGPRRSARRSPQPEQRPPSAERRQPSAERRQPSAEPRAAPSSPALDRAKKLLKKAESFEKKTSGVGREIKRAGRDARRQRRQLSPEGPLANTRRNSRRTAASASPARANPPRRATASPPPPSRARSTSAGRARRHEASPVRSSTAPRTPRLTAKAEEQVERLYTNDVERRALWREQRAAEQAEAELGHLRPSSRRVDENAVKKRWNDIQQTQRRKAEWVAAEKAMREEQEAAALEDEHWKMSRQSKVGGRWHMEDGRDVGTRTHAWRDKKKAELLRKERELKRQQRLEERGSLGAPVMSKGSKEISKDLGTDVIARNEAFVEGRDAKIEGIQKQREEERAKQQQETITLGKNSATLVEQGRHKGSDVLSRNKDFQRDRQERLAAADFAEAEHDRRRQLSRSAQRAMQGKRRSSSPQPPSADSGTSMSPAEGNPEVDAEPEATTTQRRRVPMARAGAKSVFSRRRSVPQEQVSEHDRSYGSSAASRTSSGNSSVAFGSTYTPRRGGGGDSSGRQRSSVEELRSSSHHAEVVASVEEDPAPEPEHEPLLGDRRARQNSPVELSLRCVTDQRLALPFR